MDHEQINDKIPKTTKERVYSAFDYILCKLNAREERVLRMRSGLMFNKGEVLTLEEIAQHFSITRQRTKEIEAEALGKLENMVLQIKSEI